MSVFTSSVRHRPWLTQVTLLAVLLGALLALSLKTQDRIRGEQLPSMRISQVAAAYADLRENNLDLNKQVADLRKQLTKYQKAVGVPNDNTKLLSADLQKANLLAGLVPVVGPGIVVTLRDAKNPPPKPSDMAQEAYIEMLRPYLIHDQDIQAIINELRAAGVEAIAINDQRVVSTTAVRCVGPSVLVNNVATNGSPVRIKAIGDAETMASSLMMAGGVSDQYKITDPTMISIDKVKELTLPSFAGAAPIRFAQPASEQKGEQAQRDSEKAAAQAPIPTGATSAPENKHR